MEEDKHSMPATTNRHTALSPARAQRKLSARWRARQQELERCRRLLRAERGRRTVVAFYANPFLPPAMGMPPLQQLTREMRHLMRTVSPFDVSIEPCSSMEDVRTRVAQFRPRVVLFSGHSWRGTLLLENAQTGAAFAPPPAELRDALASVDVVALFGCHTADILHVLQPRRAGIGFSSLVVDGAARAFAHGVATELGRQVRTRRVDAARLHAAGLAAWEREGFVVGDPERGRETHGVPVLVTAV